MEYRRTEFTEWYDKEGRMRKRSIREDRFVLSSWELNKICNSLVRISDNAVRAIPRNHYLPVPGSSRELPLSLPPSVKAGLLLQIINIDLSKKRHKGDVPDFIEPKLPAGHLGYGLIFRPALKDYSIYCRHRSSPVRPIVAMNEERTIFPVPDHSKKRHGMFFPGKFCPHFDLFVPQVCGFQSWFIRVQTAKINDSSDSKPLKLFETLYGRLSAPIKIVTHSMKISQMLVLKFFCPWPGGRRHFR